MAEIGRLAHAAGALFVAVVEPVSLAVLAPPGEYGADIAAGEGQPLGIAPQYGGPYLGILAATERAGPPDPRSAGRARRPTSTADERYVMTLRAREQDIRREKAASNICTNQALCAARPRRSTWPRSARTGCATWRPVAPPAPASSSAALADGRRAARPQRAPTSTSSRSRVPDAARVHAALLDARRAGRPAAGALVSRRRPTARTPCWSARPRSPPSDEIERFADALALEIGAGAAMVEAVR